MTDLHIAPNKPVALSLVDPEGQFDFDRGTGRYETTTGQLLTLPRPAVVLLNTIDPKPNEEIVIQKIWSGRKSDKVRWTIALSPKSEKARAEAGEPDTLTRQLEASLEQVQERKAPVRAPTPIGRPSKRQPSPELQPRLFDRGTGTDSPAPAQLAPLILPAAAAIRKSGQIPANVATREILEFVNADPGTANWSADAKQDLCSTILIASFKAGYIGLWERQG